VRTVQLQIIIQRWSELKHATVLMQIKLYHRWAEIEINAHIIATKHGHVINNINNVGQKIIES
jgi:hypothetical protein